MKSILEGTHCYRLFIVLLFFNSNNLQAQNIELYKYSNLSDIFYKKQVDSLKKAWECPVLYKDKETQKKFKEIWTERTDFLIGAIESRNFIYEKDIYEYVSNIVSQITNANKTLVKSLPLLLIDRSSVVNAYSVGNNIIIVNLGLLTFCKSREELALVIAHELSHDILEHAPGSMKKKAEWLTSDEYKKSLNSILDSKYERYTKLTKIFQEYRFSRSRHNRYHEDDADSLGIVLLKTAGIYFNAGYFLRLDSTDLQYKSPLKQPLNEYLTGYGLTFNDWWAQKKSKGLSTRSFSFKDTTILDDSLKTHPDCIQRYTASKKYSEVFTETIIPAALKEKANKMILWNLFDNLALTACAYRIFLEKDNGNKDPFYDFMLYNVFSGLYYQSKQLNRFNAIGIKQKEYISKNYYELQNMIEQMPMEDLAEYCKKLGQHNFWNSTTADQKALKTLFTQFNFTDELTDKQKAEAAKSFLNSYPESLYGEFADHFKKK